MSLDYLKHLNERYENWISTYKEGKLLIINSDELDFEKNAADLGTVIDKVDSALYGLF
jgi:deoxyadenosine/deoxycytidine kinase